MSRFSKVLHDRPATTGIDVVTTLRHFAILSYTLDPERLRAHLHPRFVPDCVRDAEGRERALLSVVPFFDVDFRLACCPWPQLSFGQTNYRAYVIDTETGERAAWFFGTCLDSLAVWVPHSLWKLPWHGGRIQFDCQFSAEESRYLQYRMETTSPWAPASVELCDSGQAVRHLEGFEDLESALVVLTHPMRGFFHRRDGELGTYRIWHDRLRMSEGGCVHARFPLLEQLDLVPLERQGEPHSVLMQHETDFTIYLPPQRISRTPNR